VPLEDAKTFADVVAARLPGQPKQDHTLQDPHTVLQLLKRHYARYTPELVEQVCGTPRDVFKQVAETLLAHSGPDKPSAICYAVGWTQHTTGVN
jgi:formate dehydrogenase major subunit